MFRSCIVSRIYPRAMDGWKEAIYKKGREAMSMKSLLAEAVAGWLAKKGWKRILYTRQWSLDDL